MFEKFKLIGLYAKAISAGIEAFFSVLDEAKKPKNTTVDITHSEVK